MAQRLFGVEIEYGFAAVDATASNSFHDGLTNYALESLMTTARKELVQLPGSGNVGLFTENGSRLYADCQHPEFASPEVDNPTDCCRYVMANDQTLRQLVEKLRLRQLPRAKFVLWKGNVDYIPPYVTYGCHESYLHVCQSVHLPQQLIPHFVSRVYLAAGGLDPTFPGIRFSLFPRAAFFTRDISSSSTSSERGIYHTREESHACGNFRRLHVICGDSTSLGLWLKTASTALILALVEAGFDLGSKVYPSHPVQALRTFAADPQFRATTALADGRHVTALDIQFHYLSFVENHLDHPNLPPWAEQACRVWRETLTRADKGPAALARSMDWAIKLSLFQAQMNKRGFQAHAVTHFNHALDTFGNVLVQKKVAQPLSPATLPELLAGPLANAVPDMRGYLADHGLRLDALVDFLRLRAELCEMDCRFSQLFPSPGILTALLPHLAPLAPMPDHVEQAQKEAPAATRAGIRGRYIRRFAGRRHCSADWTEIRHAHGRRLDLSHPFGQNVRWHRVDPDEVSTEPFLMLDGLFRTGRYAEVLERLRLNRALGPNQLETYILACARVGRSREAFAGLERYEALRPARLPLIALSLSALVSLGLVPSPTRMRPLIEEGDRLLTAGESADEYYSLLYAQNKGRALCAWGAFNEALAVLQQELARPGCLSRPRNRSRVQMYLSEVHRCRGELDQAQHLYEQAATVYQQEHLLGDLADYALPLAAKLTADAQQARAALEQAAAIQTEHFNPLGLARVLCLKARRLGTREDLPRITELCNVVETLRTCPTAGRVVSQFDQWMDADRSRVEGLDYWGL